MMEMCFGFHGGKSECHSTPPFSCQVPMEEVPDQELEVTSSKLKPARTEATRPTIRGVMVAIGSQGFYSMGVGENRLPIAVSTRGFPNFCYHPGGEQPGIHMHTPICKQLQCQKTSTTDGRTRAFLKVKESSNPASLSL